MVIKAGRGGSRDRSSVHQTDVGRSPRTKRRTIDGKDTSAHAVADDDLRAGGVRVLHRVRQRLLHEPVGRQIHAGGKLGRLTLHVHLDRQAGLACLLDEPLEVLETRLRRQCRRLFGAPQHAYQPPHLGERLPARLLDHEQRFALTLLLRAKETPHAGGLHGHHADAVADDVV